MSTNASASIIEVTVNQTISIPGTGVHSAYGASVPLSGLAGRGFKDFLKERGAGSSKSADAVLFASHLDFFVTAGDEFAVRYASGNPIAGGPNSRHGYLWRNNSGSDRGQWKGGGTGFAGFKTISGDMGWIEVSVSSAGHTGYPNEVDIIAYAYNTVAGGAIDAGQGPSSTVPEPDTASLGLLAAGAAGLLALRRRRAKMAANP